MGRPQAIVPAYLLGDLTTAQLTTVEAAEICWRAPSRCPVVMLVLDESSDGVQRLARPPIATIPQLRSRRVAVTESTLGGGLVSRAFRSTDSAWPTCS